MSVQISVSRMEGVVEMEAAEAGPLGNKRKPCPLHGCKRVYTDVSSLEAHIKDHEIPAQSLPGKVLLCSTVGCSGSFSNMQKLMEHMRHHHKPNIYFLCESCRTKLRSYRGLLTHLHTCSKMPRAKTRPAEPVAPVAPVAPLPGQVAEPNTTPMDMDQSLAELEPTAQKHVDIPNSNGSFATAAAQPQPTAQPALTPLLFSNPDSSPAQLAHQQLPGTGPQSQLRNEVSDLPLSANVIRLSTAPDPPDAQGPLQTQTKSPVLAPLSPPGSAAVWKKNQGMACSRRVLWEHTRGRYTCVQCGFAVTNRKDMTHHINAYHSSSKPAEDTGGPGTTT